MELTSKFNLITYSDCEITGRLSKNEKVLLTIVNPSSMTRTNEVVRVKVPPGVAVKVEDVWNESSELLSDLFCSKKYTYEGYIDDCDLYILVPSINALSTRSMVLSEGEKKPVQKSANSDGYTDFMISYNSTSDSEIRLDYGRCYKTDCESHRIFVDYRYYQSYEGDGQKSGLYIFRDQDAGASSKPYNKLSEWDHLLGDVVSILDVKGDTVDVRIVINNHSPVQTATVVSRVKGIEGEHGKEVTVKFTTLEVDSDKFYTDSNGMIMEERILNHRNSYPLTNLTGYEVVSNFYPVNSALTLRSEDASNQQFTILNDRAQSASSLKSGEIEFLIDRRTYFDDDRGVEEPLNETTSDGKSIIVETYHHIISASVDELRNKDYMETKRLQRTLVEEPLQTLFSVLNKDISDDFVSFEKVGNLKYIGSLPPSVKVVTKVMNPVKIMVRLYNMNEAFDGFDSFVDVDLSGVIADLAELREQSGHNVAFKITEWNLSLNQEVGKSKNVNWSFKNGKAIFNGQKETEKAESIIHLDNQDMRSFIIEFEQDQQIQTKE